MPKLEGLLLPEIKRRGSRLSETSVCDSPCCSTWVAGLAWLVSSPALPRREPLTGFSPGCSALPQSPKAFVLSPAASSTTFLLHSLTCMETPPGMVARPRSVTSRCPAAQTGSCWLSSVLPGSGVSGSQWQAAFRLLHTDRCGPGQAVDSLSDCSVGSCYIPPGIPGRRWQWSQGGGGALVCHFLRQGWGHCTSPEFQLPACITRPLWAMTERA